MSQIGNFAAYRSHLSHASPPFIPYPGCATKDLLFLLDGNPDYINKLLNVSKMAKIAETIFEFKRGESEPYKFDVRRRDSSKWRFLSDGYVAITDNELDWWSRQVEPASYEAKIEELLKKCSQFESEIGRLRKEKEVREREWEREREGYLARLMEDGKKGNENVAD